MTEPTQPDRPEQSRPDRERSSPGDAGTRDGAWAAGDGRGAGPAPSQGGPSGPPPYLGHPPPAVRPGGNGVGTVSLIAGIVSVVICWIYGGGLIFGVVAIVLGQFGTRKADRGEASNRSVARAGFVLGIVGAALSVAYLVVLVIGFGLSHNNHGQ